MANDISWNDAGQRAIPHASAHGRKKTVVEAMNHVVSKLLPQPIIPLRGCVCRRDFQRLLKVRDRDVAPPDGVQEERSAGVIPEKLSCKQASPALGEFLWLLSCRYKKVTRLRAEQGITPR